MSKSTYFIFLAFSLLVLFSCGNSAQNQTETPEQETAQTEPAKPAPEKKPSFTINYPALDANTKLEEATKIVQDFAKSIDDNASKLELKQATKTISDVPNTPLSIWYLNGVPVKIEHAVADEAGLTEEVFTYYLKEGKPLYLNQIYARYIFNDQGMKWWLDKNWEANDIPEKNFNARAEQLRETVENLSSLMNEG